MTCREKLKMEHPELVSDEFLIECIGCPSDYDYLDTHDFFDYCSKHSCEQCWDTEIDELHTEETAINELPSEETVTRDDSKTIIDIITNAMKMKDMSINLYFGDSGITCNIYPYKKD